MHTDILHADYRLQSPNDTHHMKVNILFLTIKGLFAPIFVRIAQNTALL